MSETLTVVQITDTHLHSESWDLLRGVDTRASLQAVLDLVRRRPRAPDLVLATGDLAHDGSFAAYRQLREQFLTLGDLPVYWLPGNHDDPRVMRTALPGDKVVSSSAVAIGSWRVVLLDSTVPELVGGRLGPVELGRLQRALAAHPDAPTLVCLHHHPVPVGSPWIDESRLEDADAFFTVLARHDQVRAVLCGHVHQEFCGRHSGVQVLAAPSTCVQFKPNTAALVVDRQNAGYRWLELHADGRMATGVERL